MRSAALVAAAAGLWVAGQHSAGRRRQRADTELVAAVGQVRAAVEQLEAAGAPAARAARQSAWFTFVGVMGAVITSVASMWVAVYALEDEPIMARMPIYAATLGLVVVVAVSVLGPRASLPRPHKP